MNRWLAVPAIVHLVAALLWLWAFGMRPTYDTTLYTSGAESIATGKGFLCESRHSPTGWTVTNRYQPGYSSVIALGVRVGLSSYLSAGIISFGTAALCASLVAWICMQHGASMLLSVWLGCGFAWNQGIIRASVGLWSEPVAICLVLCAIIFAEKRPVFAGIAAAVAWTMRNAMASIALALGGYYLRNKQWRNVVLCLIGGIVGGGWLVVCNLLKWGSVYPYTGRSSDGNLLWYLWEGGKTTVVLLSPAVVLLCVYRPRLLAPVTSFLVAYLIVLLASKMRYHLDPINYRYLMPVFPIGIIALASRVDVRLIRLFAALWPLWSAAQTLAVLT